MGYERSTKSPQKCACFCSTKICYPGIAVSKFFKFDGCSTKSPCQIRLSKSVFDSNVHDQPVMINRRLFALSPEPKCFTERKIL